MTSTHTSVVASAATDQSVLPLNELVLVGTFTGPAGALAVIRNRLGTVRTVRTGDTLWSGRVTAIDETQVILDGIGGRQVLSITH